MCVEVAYYSGGYEFVRVVVKKVLEAMSHRGNGMVYIDESRDYSVVFFYVNDYQVGVCEGVVEDVVCEHCRAFFV